MKKIFLIFLILIISTFCLTACDENPYTGEYESSNSTILILKENNSCTIIQQSYKEAFYTEGKYVIQNNNINITFDKNKQNYYRVLILKGKFEGSSIKFSNSIDSKHNIYTKQ